MLIELDDDDMLDDFEVDDYAKVCVKLSKEMNKVTRMKMHLKRIRENSKVRRDNG